MAGANKFHPSPPDKIGVRSTAVLVTVQREGERDRGMERKKEGWGRKREPDGESKRERGRSWERKRR